ncbi:MAG: hypothetical protein ACOWWH_12530 [Eubacteriaceae bacterium]
MKLNIKPLSVNKVWKGKRFKTNDYKNYERIVLLMLPKLDIPKNIKLQLTLKVGFSSKGSDLDNMCKPFQDILSKKYGFNDNQIYKLIMTKDIVEKGKEYIDFDICEYLELNEILNNPIF